MTTRPPTSPPRPRRSRLTLEHQGEDNATADLNAVIGRARNLGWACVEVQPAWPRCPAQPATAGVAEREVRP